MSGPPAMHDGELRSDAPLVRRLLAGQFPQWAALAVERCASGGTVHAIYRLGEELCVRLPLMDWGAEDADRDRRWLPRLAPHLPVEVPEVVAIGEPAEGVPWRWGVYRWLEGEHPAVGRGDARLARELAAAVLGLQAVGTAGAPTAGRGRPVRETDAGVRASLARLGEQVAAGLHGSGPDTIDMAALTAAWDRAVAAPDWEGPPVWLHGDLKASNLLLRGGRLTGLLDWGGMGVGDPSCELVAAWEVFDAPARDVFRAELGADDATWERGRGWALYVAIMGLPYYRETNPDMVASTRQIIRSVLAK